jgi:hypothetical protein
MFVPSVIHKYIMKKTNNLIFTGLQIVAWIIFIGLCIEAGGLLVNFVFSIYNPDMISRLYNKLNLMAMYQRLCLLCCIFLYTDNCHTKSNFVLPRNYFTTQVT